MNNLFQNFNGEHPPQEQFLLYVDGELASKEAAGWQSHLDACWSCRVRVGKIEETIADIIEFEETISQFQSAHNSPNWGNFDSRLNAASQETRRKSKFWSFWKEIENFLSFNWAGKMVTASLAVLLIFTIFYQFVFVSPVSASELLEKATAARRENLKTANQPVIYQKLKISAQNKSAVFELWNEVTAAKNKKSADSQADVLHEYESVLERNGFDPLKPLSPENYQSWRNRFAAKVETVTLTKTADGANAFELTTVINPPREIGEITQTSLIVREDDWHAVSQSIQIKTEDGSEVFEVSELEFRVLNRDALAENFFGSDVTISKEITVKTKPGASPEENPLPSPSAEKSPEITVKTESSPNAPQATADLEVEVLSLLNRTKADLGEQITVTRENGLLKVRGIVETARRKQEILTALQSVSGNPSVRIVINTVAEALAAEKNKSKQSPTVQELQTENSSISAENDLTEHLGSVEAARTFANQMVSRSGRAMNHAYALKRLVGQFKPEELKQLSPEARAKWLALVRSHARAFQTETENLRGELQKVFGATTVAAADTPPVNNIADLPRAIEALLDFASTNDRVVRSAMTVSAGTQFSAIKTAQFWQSLKTAESLAVKLQMVK